MKELVVVVSHDQTFLNNCIAAPIEVASQTLTLYAGNYAFYKEEESGADGNSRKRPTRISSRIASRADGEVLSVSS